MDERKKSSQSREQEKAPFTTAVLKIREKGCKGRKDSHRVRLEILPQDNCTHRIILVRSPWELWPCPASRT